VDEQWEHTLAGNNRPIQLLNPIASQMNVMRSSLMGSLLQVAKFNLDRTAYRVRVFESGRVFRRDESIEDSLQTVKGIHQPVLMAGLAYGPLSPLGWNDSDKLSDFFDVKSDVCRLMTGHALTFEAAPHPALHPGRCARIHSAGQAIGWIGELHPQWRQQWGFVHAPVLFELDMDAVLRHPVPHAQAVSRLHPVERDLAIVVKEDVTHDVLMDCIRQADHSRLLNNAVLFDVYRPSKPDASVQAGEKSMAVRLSLQSTDEHTLTDAQIEGVIQSVIDSLSRQLSARLRA
jgi:phenylalanyl-tRNA synthetase beta chain